MGKQDRWQPRFTFSPPYRDDKGWKVRVCVDARRGDKVPQVEVEFLLNGENPFQQNIPLPESGSLITEIPLSGHGALHFLQVNVHDTTNDQQWPSQPQQVSVPKVSLPSLHIDIVQRRALGRGVYEYTVALRTENRAPVPDKELAVTARDVNWSSLVLPGGMLPPLRTDPRGLATFTVSVSPGERDVFAIRSIDGSASITEQVFGERI